MARTVAWLLTLEGTLHARTAIHIGGADAAGLLDQALAGDGEGRFLLPGTSLAGALREWSHAGAPEWRSLWGDAGEGGTGASAVTVFDAPIDVPFGGGASARTGVGIDRVTGAAADEVYYDLAVLPRGSRMPLRVEIEAGEPDAEERELLDALAGALARGEIALGRARTRGLGAVELTDAAISAERLDAAGDILDAVERRLGLPSAPELKRQPPGTGAARQLRVAIDVTWHPAAAVMSRAPYDGAAVDALPLVEAVDDDRVALVLPGSSIKGSLRTMAERIVRTVLGRSEDPRRGAGGERHLSAVDVPLVRALFGAAVEHDGDTNESFQGALAVRDCYSVTTYDAEAWWALVNAASSAAADRAGELHALRAALRALASDGTTLHPSWHVAIDRWSGGAAEQLLFSTLEPRNVAWEPLRLQLRPDRLGADTRPAFALLLLTLEELRAGNIPLGFAANRGGGSIGVESVRLADGSGGIDDLPPAGELRLSTLAPGTLDALRTAWANWIAEQAP